VPLLFIVFNLPIVSATSTSLLTIAPTGISGSIRHFRQKTVSFSSGLMMGGFGAVASIGGALLADQLPPFVTIVITAVVILFSVSMMLRSLFKDKTLGTKKAKPAKEEELEVPASRVTAAAEDATAETIIGKADAKAPKEKGETPFSYILIIGIIAGLIAGVVGVGGGFIIVPFCVAYMGYSLKRAAGTSLVAISLIAIPGIITHAALGHIEWLYGVALMIGTIPGAQLGSWLIARLPERPMRFAFAGLLACIGILMLAQEFFIW